MEGEYQPRLSCRVIEVANGFKGPPTLGICFPRIKTTFLFACLRASLHAELTSENGLVEVTLR